MQIRPPRFSSSSSLTARLARHWPTVAIALVLVHAIVQGYLHSRPGAAAIAVFSVAPRALFALTILTIAAAVYDILYGGWRRLLRGTVIFPLGALASSVLLTLITYRVYPSSHDDRPATWCLALPLAGDVVVLQGGSTLDANAHAGSPSQRYAYDLGIVPRDPAGAGGRAGVPHGGAYGQPVSAPVKGLVVSVTDDVPEQAPGDAERRHGSGAIGNHVVLQVDDGQYLVVGRLQAESIRVRAGDHVEQGELVARVGSPDADLPHLHLHLQDHPAPGQGEAIPVDVCHYEAITWGASWDTARPVERGMPTGRERRQIIRASSSPPR
jgi:hypothetical protein